MATKRPAMAGASVGVACYRSPGVPTTGWSEKALGEPLEAEPWRLEQPVPAARSAAWWWAGHGLNELADRGEFAAITRRINGGLNGQAERLALWQRARAVLS